MKLAMTSLWGRADEALAHREAESGLGVELGGDGDVAAGEVTVDAEDLAIGVGMQPEIAEDDVEAVDLLGETPVLQMGREEIWEQG